MTTDAALWPDGKAHEILVLEGRLTLCTDGSFKQEIHSRRAVDGVPTEDLGWHTVSGTYKRGDSTLVARAEGVRVPVTYDMSDGGRVLTGAPIQPAGRGIMISTVTYEWVLGS